MVLLYVFGNELSRKYSGTVYIQNPAYSTNIITFIYVATLKPVTLSLLVIDCNILLSFRLNSSLLK